MLRLVGIVTTTVLAIAYFLDIYFARRKSVIYGRFLDWWYWLSNLKFQRAIHGSIAITRRGIELLCGRRILSFTGIMRSAAILGVIAAARILWFSPSNDISIQTITFVVLLVIPIIPPGVVLLMIVRLLLRSAEKQPTLNHLVALGILNLLFVQLLFGAIWFAYGLAAERWITAAYTHGVKIDDTQDIIGGAYAYFFVFSRIYGIVVLFPLAVFTALFVWWVLIIAISSLFHLVEEFLRLQVEEYGPKPLTSIATALCMATVLAFPAMLGISRLSLQEKFNYIQQSLSTSAMLNGARFNRHPQQRNFDKKESFPDYELKCLLYLEAIQFMGPGPGHLRRFGDSLKNVRRDWTAANGSR